MKHKPLLTDRFASIISLARASCSCARLDVDWEVAAIRQDRTDVTSSGVVVVPDATTQATIVLTRR